MVSRTPTISIQERKVRWVYGTVVASTNDTFPISDLQSVTIILGCLLYTSDAADE